MNHDLTIEFLTTEADRLRDALEAAQAAEEQACSEIVYFRARWADALAENAELAASVREWLCVKCNTVYPGPPQHGVMCVVCPNCDGDCAPREVMLRRRAEEERDRLASQVTDLHCCLKQWVEYHDKGYSYGLLPGKFFVESRKLVAGLGSLAEQPEEAT